MATLMHEVDPVVSALDLVERTGDIRALVTTPTQRRGLTNALLKRRVIRWNRWMSRYELTRRGRRVLAEHRSARSAPLGSRARRGMVGRMTVRVGAAACVLATVGLAMMAGPGLSSRTPEESAALAVPAAAEELRVPVIAHDDSDPAPAPAPAAIGAAPVEAAPAAAAKAEPTTVQKPTKARRKVTKHRRNPYRSRGYAHRPSRWWNPMSAYN